MSSTPFFIVWNPANMMTPTFRHATRESAETEAQRLAGVSPGDRFHVCRVESYAEAPKPSATLVKLEEPKPEPAQVTKQVDPEVGEGYRRLKDGETLQPGDEWFFEYAFGGGEWRKTSHPGDVIGDENGFAMMQVYRRRVGF